MSMKICSKCGVEKEETEFAKDRHTKDGLRNRCRSCMSAIWKADYAANPEYYKQRSTNWAEQNPLKRKRIQKHADLMILYNLPLVEYERMFLEQKGCCAICNSVMATPYVDHCHSSGKVRALLCPGCNTGLGGFKDLPDLLLKAVGYIQKFSS